MRWVLGGTKKERGGALSGPEGSVLQWWYKGGVSMEIQVQLPREEAELVRVYAKRAGLSESDFIKQAVMRRIENDEEFQAAQKAAGSIDS